MSPPSPRCLTLLTTFSESGEPRSKYAGAARPLC